MTFDAQTWISIGIMDYLTTKFEVYEVRGCELWVIGCTKCFRGLPPDRYNDIPTCAKQHAPFLLSTWISIGIIYSSKTIYMYLPSLKLQRQSVLELSVAQGAVDGHDLWPLTWLSRGIIYSSMTIYLTSLKFLGQSVLELSVAQSEVDGHDLRPWPLTYWPEYQ